MPDETPDSFGLLFVCTGNICRSPFAELLTAHMLAERLGDQVRSFWLGSAGVNAVVGSKMHPDSRMELIPWGLGGAYAGRFTARQIEREMVERADVVLTMATEHRSAVLKLAPRGLAKTFTIREFARLVGAVDPAALPLEPVARAHALVAQAPRKRGLVRADSAEDDSVPDPIGRSKRAHQIAAHQIAAAAKTIVDVIAP